MLKYTIMKREIFEKLVAEGIDLIPPSFQKKLDNVAVIVADRPTKAQLKKLRVPKRELLLGLYEGVPQAKRNYYYASLPDKITIFQEPIERDAGEDPGKIRQIVRDTVYHEIGHHFGFDEKGIRRVEQKRRGQMGY